MSNITKCDKRQSGLFLFQRRLDNKYTIKRESKTTGGDQVKNEQQSDRGHDRRTRYGKFLVSYNDCPEIREIWDKPNIHIEEISRLNNLAQRYDGGCQYAELLISNYDTSERLQAVRQLSLFDDETDNLEV